MNRFDNDHHGTLMPRVARSTPSPVIQVMGKPIGLLSPVANPTPDLRLVSSFIRRISVSDIAAAQFPDPVVRPDGSLLTKPASWV